MKKRMIAAVTASLLLSVLLITVQQWESIKKTDLGHDPIVFGKIYGEYGDVYNNTESGTYSPKWPRYYFSEDGYIYDTANVNRKERYYYYHSGNAEVVRVPMPDLSRDMLYRKAGPMRPLTLTEANFEAALSPNHRWVTSGEATEFRENIVKAWYCEHNGKQFMILLHKNGRIHYAIGTVQKTESGEVRTISSITIVSVLGTWEEMNEDFFLYVHNDQP